MNQAEGYVIHHQLDAMVKALATFDEMANEADDHDVRALMARLYEAREAALKVACRRPVGHKAVSLAKRR